MDDRLKIVILGGGESGTGSAVLAREQGYEVFVSDSGQIAEKYRLELQELEVPFEEGKHTFSRMADATEVIKSPGIPETAPVVQSFRKMGIPVRSEEHTSELQSLMRISYAVFCLQKKTTKEPNHQAYDRL